MKRQLDLNNKKDKIAFGERWKRDRHRGRTDLFWLANVVLSPADSRIMQPHAHGCIVDHCQKFVGRRDVLHAMDLRGGTPRLVDSQEVVPMWDLQGPRDTMLLVSRGHLKTTINTIAHSIQWILNYPDVRILLVTATEEKAMLIVNKIKQHFQFNAYFRFLYPEYCPDAKKVSDWGSSTQIRVVTPWNKKRGGDEPTIMTAAVGKALASTHHDVIKISDVVTENNVKTPGQIQEVKDFMSYMEPLRERGPARCPTCRKTFTTTCCAGVTPDLGLPNPGWLTDEGTIYDFADFHQTQLDEDAKRETKMWFVTKQSCWVNKEKRLALWPERFPPAELDRIRDVKMGPVIFSSQYELEPIRSEEGLATPDEIKFFEAHLVRQLMPRYRVWTTVDLADMDPQTQGDFVVFTTCGFDGDGRCDVLSIMRGRYSQDYVIEAFFVLQRFFPSNIGFKVQKDHFARTLRTPLQREQAKRNTWLNIEMCPIDTRVSKVHRIKQLRWWFKQGIIRFADNIPCKSDLIMEILRFPRGAHDDILDTLADQMQNRDGEPNADAMPDAPRGSYPDPIQDTFLEFDPITKEQRWLRDTINGAHATYDEMTGV